MKVGLSWDLGQQTEPVAAWRSVVDEIALADGLGYDSAWFSEGRDTSVSCPQPSIVLTGAAAKTRNIQLVVASRTVGHAHPVRIAEEVAVLDLFATGRACIAFSAGVNQQVPAQHVHELIEFVRTAWTEDEFRYRGDYIRFPASTGEEAPVGVSEPEPNSALNYLPQWEAGPVQPEYLTITPKPYQRLPMVYVDVTEEETLEWAAKKGISPVVGADVPTEEAVERLARYRRLADEAGRSHAEVDPVLERRLEIGGSGDQLSLGGTPDELIKTIRQLKLVGGFRHLVWKRAAGSSQDGQLAKFASE
ncbi:MAG: LLM class flavin-dependent oxidoreductase, partial [Gammaproteobacteria bacterium]|nr:LLM class flavin-dependent oxidoreductase [Gammaproteobacteria bacterium]